LEKEEKFSQPQARESNVLRPVALLVGGLVLAAILVSFSGLLDFCSQTFAVPVAAER
jgi:hypothetical protein